MAQELKLTKKEENGGHRKRIRKLIKKLEKYALKKNMKMILMNLDKNSMKVPLKNFENIYINSENHRLNLN